MTDLKNMNNVLKGDCLDLMKDIPDGSIDMILCDLPYGTTKCKWDSIIDLDLLWKQYCRIIKDNGAILLFAQTPFDKTLGSSNLPMLKYEWIWEKTTATGHLNAKKMPMKAHENILVFYKNLPTYNAQKSYGNKPTNSYTKRVKQNGTADGEIYGKTIEVSGGGDTERYPRSVLKFKSDKQKEALHPTQKPLDLCKYLIKTYTNENELVLDSTAGSGTTAVACLASNRNFIVMEKEEKYIEIINNRINNFNKN